MKLAVPAAVVFAALAVLAAIGGRAAAADPIPTPIGVERGYRLPAASAPVRRGSPLGRFRCLRGGRPRVLVHVELFAHGRVLVLPAGIGMAPPLERHGAYVQDARCSYAARTTGPTGLVEVDPSAQGTLRDVFAIWGQPLSAGRLAGFRAREGDRVRAWVGGRPWRGDVRRIPLRRHAQIVVEVGGYVPPHAFFLFPR